MGRVEEKGRGREDGVKDREQKENGRGKRRTRERVERCRVLG